MNPGGVMQRLRPVHGALFCGIVAALLFLPATRNGFAYDDVAIIQLDTRVHGLDSLQAVLSQPYWEDRELSLWRPVTTLSYALDWAASDGSPAWFHFTNALWHGLATTLACLLLLHFAGVVPALAGGLLFAVHPVHVEAVANVVGRAELIAAAASFACALLWLRPAARGTRLGIALLFLLALGAKESAVMLPPLLVLLDYAAGNLSLRDPRPWLRRRSAEILALALVAAGYLVARNSVLGGALPSRYDPVLDVVNGPVERIFTALQAWPHIARLFFFPVTLLADYGPHVIMPATVPGLATLLGLAVLVGSLLGGMVAAARGHRAIAVALWWTPVALLPVSNLFFPVGIIVAERVLYLPVFALSLAAAVIASRPVHHRRALALAAAGVLLLLAARSVVRIPDWRNTDVLFAAQLRDREDSFRAHWHMGRVGVVERQRQQALAHYRRAFELWPYRQRLVMEAASFASQYGDRALARRVSEHAAGEWPEDVQTHRMAAAIALDAADTAAAAAHLRRGLEVAPNDSLLRRMHAAIAR